MGQSDATFRHHLDEIAGAELKRQIPPDAEDDDFLVKVPSFEEILCRGRFRYRQTPRVSTVCTRTLRAWLKLLAGGLAFEMPANVLCSFFL
jgi:hypothetical protein